MLIVGLGNPGKKYELTRHNLGFWVLDILNHSLTGEWTNDAKLNAQISRLTLEKRVITLMKPQCFMNRSGDSVREFLKWNEVSNLVVVYDDLDFEPGIVKLKYDGSAGGHNGLSDIIEKTNDTHISDGRFMGGKFLRIRIGIGHPRNSLTPMMDVKNWVLTKPSGSDHERLEEAANIAAEGIKFFVKEENVETAGKMFRSFLDKKKEK